MSTMACAQVKKDGFVLRGTIPGAMDSTQVSLTLAGTEKPMVVGYVVGEKFELRGESPLAACYALTIDDGAVARKRGVKFHCQEINFFIENGELTFATPSIDSLPMPPKFVGFDIRKEKNYTVTGSDVQDRFYRYQTGTLPVRTAIWRLKERYRYKRDIEIARLLQQQNEELLRMTWEAAQKEPDLGLRLYLAELLEKDQFLYDQAYLDKMGQLFAGNQDTCAALADFCAYLEKAKAFIQNTPLMEINLLTPEGKSVSLHSLLNKEGYTLLDFWASYCGPCRASFPHLKEVYKRTNGKLQIIGISTDVNNNAWLKALDEEQLPWVQVHSDKRLAASLNVPHIPAYYIVDADGKVVFFGGVFGELDLELEELGLE